MRPRTALALVLARAAILIVAIILSGCAGTSSPATPTATALPSRVAAITGCADGCWEPMIAIDHARRIFVVAGTEQLAAVSTDDGRTFAPLTLPPFPPNMPPATERVDQTIATDPSDRLFFAAFLMLPVPSAPSTVAPTGVGPRVLGLQIATSLDHGASWATDEFFSVADGAQTGVISPYKMWFGFAKDSTAYLDFNQRPAQGVFLGRSDDHGKTWTRFVRVQPDDDRILSSFFSPPVIDAEGRVFIAYFGDQYPNDPGQNSYDFQAEDLRVAISADQGRTFEHVVVAHADAPGSVGTAFPSLARDEATGRLSVGWWDGDHSTFTATSADGGATWTKPVTWDASSVVGPWAAYRAGKLAVAHWDAKTDDLVLNEGDPAGGLVTTTSLAQKSGVTGDFPHFVVDDAGRIAAVVGADRTVDVVWG